LCLGLAKNAPTGRVSLCASRTRETIKRKDTASVSVAERDSPDDVEKARKAQLAKETEIEDLHWLMSDKRGRRIAWRLLTEAGIYQSTYTGEALSSAFAEGKRAQGLKLVASIVQHCPERFSEMQKEARTHERRTSSSTGNDANTRR
jgi:hypothetical protein